MTALQEASTNLPDDADGMALRHGVVHAVMMLASLLALLLLPPLRIVQGLVEWLKRRVDRFDVRVQMGLALGLTALTVPSLYLDDWRYYSTANQARKMLGLNGGFSMWCCLGFIVSFQLTLEGTLHKAAMRACGTIAGVVCGWSAIQTVGTNNVGLIVWLLLSYVAAVWIAATPRNPLLGFNPSWGYAAQLFTYTETIIVIEAAIGLDEGGLLAIGRLLGQLTGISVAILVALLIRVHTRQVARERVAGAFELCAAVMGTLCKGTTSADSLLAAAEAKLDSVQIVLDDAKVEYIARGHERILGPGGCGLQEAREVVAKSCRIAESMCGDEEVANSVPVAAWEAAELALQEASMRLRDCPQKVGLPRSSFPGISMQSACTEVAWLLDHVVARANAAGLEAVNPDGPAPTE